MSLGVWCKALPEWVHFVSNPLCDLSLLYDISHYWWLPYAYMVACVCAHGRDQLRVWSPTIIMYIYCKIGKNALLINAIYYGRLSPRGWQRRWICVWGHPEGNQGCPCLSPDIQRAIAHKDSRTTYSRKLFFTLCWLYNTMHARARERNFQFSIFIFQFPCATPVLPLSAFLEFLDDSMVYYLAVVHCSAHVLVPQQLLHSRYAYALW